MNKMQVTLSIDLDDEGQKTAMKSFMDTLSGDSPKLRKIPAKAEEEDEEEDEDPDEAKKVAARERAAKSRAAKKKKAAEEAAKKAAEEEDEDEFDEDLEDEEIDLATLRTLTSKKVKASTDNRDAIKKKLAKFKVKNVSSLEEDDFQNFHDFLTAL